MAFRMEGILRAFAQGGQDREAGGYSSKYSVLLTNNQQLKTETWRR